MPLNNASSIISSLVWLYHANRLVVPSHTFLWEKIGYVPTHTFLWVKIGYLPTKVFFMERTSKNKQTVELRSYFMNERVTCFLSLNNASSIISSLVWLYHANRLVVPSHTFLWVKIGYLPTKVLIKQTSGVAILLHANRLVAVFFLKIMPPL